MELDIVTKGNYHRCTEAGAVRWFDHKGKRYASPRTGGFEARRVASPERAMCNWNGNRNLKKSPTYSSLRVDLSENQCEIENGVDLLCKGKRSYSGLMGYDDQWVRTGKGNPQS